MDPVVVLGSSRELYLIRLAAFNVAVERRREALKPQTP